MLSLTEGPLDTSKLLQMKVLVGGVVCQGKHRNLVLSEGFVHLI